MKSVWKYAHENGCPWDGYTCSKAAKGGHLECLKYAHENGCLVYMLPGMDTRTKKDVLGIRILLLVTLSV